MEELEIYEDLNFKGHLNDSGKDYYIRLLKGEKNLTLAERTHNALTKEGEEDG